MIKFILLLTSIVITQTSIAKTSINPFTSIIDGIENTTILSTKRSNNTHPLQQYSVRDYKLLALISSKEKAIAMLRTKKREEFLVKIGDTLGNAEGVIVAIDKQGIKIKEKDKTVLLLVRNKGVSK